MNKTTLKELTKDRLNDWWNNGKIKDKHGVVRNTKEYVPRLFGLALNRYLSDLEYHKTQPDWFVQSYRNDNHRNTCLENQIYRLIIGYNGIGGVLTPGITNLYSEEALKCNDNSLLTDDHIIGVTEVGRIVRNIIDSLLEQGLTNDEIINYMSYEWLPENLYLWVKAKITRKEHKKNNLPRNKHTLEEKVNLVHYNIGKIKLVIKG
jgi:hypothetical protein